MLSVWIADPQKGELTCLRDLTRQLVARLSNETLDCQLYRTLEALTGRAGEGDCPNLFCLDFGMEGSQPLARRMRRGSREMLLIVIAPPELSPLEYLRPDILAGGLLLRPFTAQQAQVTLREALRVCLRLREEEQDAYYWVESRNGREAVRYTDIRYFEAFNKRVSLVTGVREYQVADTLDHLEQTLSDAFVRCHRSFIVRRDCIASISLSRNTLTLDSGEDIPLSRTYKPNLKGAAK